MNFLKRTAAVWCCIVLANCGGTSSGDIDLSITQGQINAIDAVRDLDPFDPRGLQTTGSATYAGGITVFLPQDDALFGALQMSVDFAGDRFEGSAEDFRNVAEERFAGSLAVTEGIIARDGNFNADYSASALIDGDLVGADETVSVQGFIVGDFAGETGNAFRGFLRIGLNGDTFEDGDDFGGLVGAQRR